MKSADYTVSRILSYILHPLLIPTLAISALMLKPGLFPGIFPTILKFWFLAVVFAFTLVIPAISVFILLKFNAIYSIELKDRTERTIPLFITSGSYMALLLFLKATIMPPIFLYILYSATLALLVGLLLNLAFKISLHTLGWGALAATLISISIKTGIPLFPYILISILLSGVVGYARLKQNAHNQAQVYWGYIAGVSVILFISILS